MGEWLTTGQVIDKLEVGQIAIRSWDSSGTCHDRLTKIKKDSDGSIVFWDCINRIWENERLSNSLLDSIWFIEEPKYVSFIDAITAFKGEGKNITNYTDDGVYTYYWENGEPRCCDEFHSRMPLGLDFTETFEGKWTIKE